MNKLLICRLLGLISLLIGGSMVMSLPWALPTFGPAVEVELRSIAGLAGAMVVCFLVGGALMWIGRKSAGAPLFRREAIAVVGLSWLLATVLGALPFWFSGTYCGRDGDGQLIPMNVADGLFESASGFSGTGATVLTSLDDPELVPPGDFVLALADALPRRAGNHGVVRRDSGDGLGRQGPDAHRDARSKPGNGPRANSTLRLDFRVDLPRPDGPC